MFSKIMHFMRAAIRKHAGKGRDRRGIRDRPGSTRCRCCGVVKGNGGKQRRQMFHGVLGERGANAGRGFVSEGAYGGGER